MILKVLDYRQGREQNHVFEEWNFFDNIESASSYYNEETKLPEVSCLFRDGKTVSISVPNVAYLMSDSGKTIDKIIPADVEEIGDDYPIYNTLQEAVDAAKRDD